MKAMHFTCGRCSIKRFIVGIAILMIGRVSSAAQTVDDGDAEFVIQGKCLDEKFQPLAEVTVRLFVVTHRAGQGTEIARTSSVGSGRYRFAAVPRPQFDPQGGEFLRYEIVATRIDRATTIRRASPDHQVQRDVQLMPRGVLTGRVVGPSGQPVADAVVYTRGVNQHPLPEFASAKTDADGRFRFEDIAASKDGTYLKVSHPDYGQQSQTVSSVPRDVEFRLFEPAIIEGGVFDMVSRRPAIGAYVYAQAVDGSDAYDEGGTATDAGGRFRLLLSPSTYNIWASMSDRTMVAHDSFNAVAGPNVAADLNLIAGSFIEGRLLGPDGKPMISPPDRPLRIGLYGPSRPRSGAAVEFTNVNEDGTYRIRVAPGDNYPYVMSAGYATDRDGPEVAPVTVDEGQTVELDIHINGQRLQ